MTPTETAERVQEAIQDRVRAAERSLKRTRETLVDARDEAVYRVKRQPLRAVAIAFGAGTLVGLVLAALRHDRSA